MKNNILYSTNSLKQEIDILIELKMFENIIFDFKNIIQIYTSGLAMIIGRYNNTLKQQIKISIINASNDVKKF